jgi:hypothetical protein
VPHRKQSRLCRDHKHKHLLVSAIFHWSYQTGLCRKFLVQTRNFFVGRRDISQTNRQYFFTWRVNICCVPTTRLYTTSRHMTCMSTVSINTNCEQASKRVVETQSQWPGKHFLSVSEQEVGRDSSVGIVTCYGMESPGIESRRPPVAALSTALVCGRSPAGIAGSNPAGGMDVRVVVRENREYKMSVGARFSSPVQTGPGAWLWPPPHLEPRLKRK